MPDSFFGNAGGISPQILMALIQAGQGRQQNALQDRSLDLQRKQMQPGHILLSSLLQGLAQAPGQALGAIPGQLIAGGQAAQRQASDQAFQAQQNQLSRQSATQDIFKRGVAEGNLFQTGFGYMPTQPFRDAQQRAFQMKLQKQQMAHDTELHNTPVAAKETPPVDMANVNRALGTLYGAPFPAPGGLGPYQSEMPVSKDEATIAAGVYNRDQQSNTILGVADKRLQAERDRLDLENRKLNGLNEYRKLVIQESGLNRKGRSLEAMDKNSKDYAIASAQLKAEQTGLKTKLAIAEQAGFAAPEDFKAIREEIDKLDSFRENTLDGHIQSGRQGLGPQVLDETGYNALRAKYANVPYSQIPPEDYARMLQYIQNKNGTKR